MLPDTKLHIGFSRIQNLHISQTLNSGNTKFSLFSRIQNLHISQTVFLGDLFMTKFSRIQNLHISQTKSTRLHNKYGLVEFKIYISLKQR